MARRIETVFLPGPAGRLEALIEEPEHGAPMAAAVVCHPHPQHGGTMHNKVVYRIARALRSKGVVVLRFNYRGVNLSEGVYDHGNGEIDDARTALAEIRSRYPELPWLVAGFSFGARIALRIGADAHAQGPQAVIATGFPVRYFATETFAPLAAPRHFVLSTNDEFAPVDGFRSHYHLLPEPKTLTLIDAKDHFFAGSLDAFEQAVAGLV